MGQRLDNARALYLEAIRDGDYERAINTYAGERYTQHSTPVKDGKEGFIEFFADFVERNPIRDIEILRCFEDGPYVFLHVLQTLNDGEYRYVTADIFDTDDDAKLIEHWDIIAEVEDQTISGHSSIDGPTEIVDLDKTAQNKAVVTAFTNDILQGGNYRNLSRYVSEQTFTQHNAHTTDGIAGLDAFLSGLAEIGSRINYREVHNVIGSGNFVATLSEVELRGNDLVSTDMAVIDLYRLDSDRIVEHWDVAEEIQPRDIWVNSGKF